jgi:hypothetical protein
MAGSDFKVCSKCGRAWHTQEDFVCDADLEVNGYQAAFGDPDEGLILVTDQRDSCGTTLGVEAGTLRPLYRGPDYRELCTGTDLCEGLCVDEHRLEECSAPCAMAWVRVVLQYLRQHKLP